MILYHGTNIDFDKIELTKSKPNKDFGKGFYLSSDYDQALAMAKVKVEQLESGEPMVLAFEVDEVEIEQLNILRFHEYSEEWAKFILLNRKNDKSQPAHDYDIVFGLSVGIPNIGGKTKNKYSYKRNGVYILKEPFLLICFAI